MTSVSLPNCQSHILHTGRSGMAASAALLLLASAPATGRSSPFCAAGCLRVHAARSRLACGHDSCVGEHAVLRLRRRYIDFGEAAALVSGGGAPLANTKATWRLLGMLKRSPRSGLPRRAKLVSSMAWRAAIGTGSTDSSMAPCAQRALAAYISCVCAGDGAIDMRCSRVPTCAVRRQDTILVARHRPMGNVPRRRRAGCRIAGAVGRGELLYPRC